MTHRSLIAVVVAFGLGRTAGAIPQPPHDEATHGVKCLDCHAPYASLSDPAQAVGAAGEGSTAVTLVDLSKAWTDGQWIDGVITFTSGANQGEFRTVTANTATALAWALPLAAPLADGDGYQLGKTTYYDIETKCKSCHNPTGQASATAKVGLHVVAGGVVVGCGKCHDPHAIEPTGASLVRNTLRWSTAKPTTFPSGGPNPFIAGAPGFAGICETCHTKTAHHTNAAGGDHAHNAAATCTTCHPHEAGFKATGGDCTGCHASPQDNGDGIPAGGRRPVMGEFPQGEAHAHYGAKLEAASCTVCHDQTTHMDGHVDLLDPDGGTIYRFVTQADLTSDPDLSDFCMHCHDEEGAERLSTPKDPFGGGNAPPDIASRFKGTLQWEEAYGDFCTGTEGTGRRVNSHHDLSGADQAWSGAKVECLSCHGAHSASASTKTVDPFAPTTPWAGTTTALCLSCHNGGAGPQQADLPPGVTGPTVALRGLDSCGYTAEPWWVDYTWTNSTHGPSSKRGWPGYSGAPSSDMPCTTCHDPHGSWSPTNPEGNPYAIIDGVDGTTVVDDGTRTAGFYGPPWTVMGQSRPVKVGVSGLDVGWGTSTGLCNACHAGWLDAYDWHAYCTSCQTCHAHGAAWMEHDWAGGGNNQPCP